MKRVFVLKILLYFSLCLLAKDQEIDLWRNVDAINAHNIKLYVYSPHDSIKNGTSVIICPGGSYHHLGINHEGKMVAEWLNKMGITAFVLKYRVSSQGWSHPAMIQDLQRSIQLVRENADEYGIKDDAVGVLGFSAGGHLVGMASEFYQENFMKSLGIIPQVSLKPDFTIMIYPVVSMQDSLAHHKSRKNLLGRNFDTQLKDLFSLEKHVNSNMPPTLIIHAKDDNVVNFKNSYYLYKNMIASGALADFILYENGGHGFGVKPGNPVVPEWQRDCIEWLNKIGVLSV